MPITTGWFDSRKDLTPHPRMISCSVMKQLLMVSLASICLVFASSCGSEAEAKLCGSCGQEKGAAKCCADGAEVCEKCEKHKGSPGCCK